MTDGTRVVVLGGGPAGDVAALRAAQLGAQVTMIERAELGGTCLNWGCIPTKALLATADLLRRVRRADEYGLVVPEVSFDFPKMMSRKEDVVLQMRRGVESAAKRKGVTVVRGEGRVEGDEVVVGDERIPYDHLVVCVGTEPDGLPGYDMSHPAVLTSNEILRLERVPESMVVVGGGVIGCEFASLFAALGTKITVVEILPRLLAGIDERTAKQFQKLMEKEGVVVHLGRQAQITDYRDDGVAVKLDDGTEVSAEKLLVSVGRKSQAAGIGLEEIGVEITDRGHVVVDEYLRTANPKVWAVGDCIGGLQLAHLASAEGGRAVENALSANGMLPMDRTVVPSCIYTHPEIATVGLNADAAKEAGYNVKLGQARFLGSGKALGEGEPDGYAQLVMDADTQLLLGATIMGVHAVEMIHEIGVAISDGLTVPELGEVIHAHPTVSEMVMDAAQQAVGVAPYLS